MSTKSNTSKDNQSTTSKSGITTDENGQRHIPSSVRADGSVRKEIKIRPGYRPPEDVEVYRNRTAESFRNRGKGAGVPGADVVEDDKQDGSSSTAAGKNAKRREARKRAAAAAAANGENHADTQDTAAQKQNGVTNEKQSEVNGEDVNKDPDAGNEKEAKKLLKKLRQARELKDRKDQGAALLPEQFQKVIRINELIRQLDNLGFDSDGEKKGESAEKT